MDYRLKCSHDFSSGYLPCPGGKSFSSFCAPLLSLSWFFSGFLLGSIACWAPPIQTSFFTAGSYIPMTKVPMLMVEVLAENEPKLAPPHGPTRPPPMGPSPPPRPNCPRSRLFASRDR